MIYDAGILNKKVTVFGRVTKTVHGFEKVVHEIKKSKAIEEAAIWQVKYYIYFLKKRGIEIEKGIIDYPEIRERKEILLSEEDEIRLERILKEIEEICRNESSPEVINDKRCKE